MSVKRVPFDWAALHRDSRGQCFICGLVNKAPGFEHDVVYEDDDVIAFLSKYPSVYGHTLVAPKAHLDGVTKDFSLREYLQVQTVVYRVSEAVRHEVPNERIYLASMGSLQGNRHAHWHVAPLPPGVPYEEQQFRALVRPNIVAMTPSESRALAKGIRSRIDQIELETS